MYFEQVLNEEDNWEANMNVVGGIRMPVVAEYTHIPSFLLQCNNYQINAYIQYSLCIVQCSDGEANMADKYLSANEKMNQFSVL